MVPLDIALLRPAQDRRTGQLGAVVGNTGGEFTGLSNNRIELTPQPAGRIAILRSGKKAELFTANMTESDRVEMTLDANRLNRALPRAQKDQLTASTKAYR